MVNENYDKVEFELFVIKIISYDYIFFFYLFLLYFYLHISFLLGFFWILLYRKWKIYGKFKCTEYKCKNIYMNTYIKSEKINI